MEQTKTQAPNHHPLLNSDECECDGKGYRLIYSDGIKTLICKCQAGIEYRAELDEKEKRDKERSYKKEIDASGIPAHFWDMTLESYPNKSLAGYKSVLSWVEGWTAPVSETPRPKRSLFIYGPFGTGKTCLAVGALKALLRHCPEFGAMFCTVPALLENIRASYGTPTGGTRSAFLDDVQHSNLLVLDDLGAERPTDWVLDQLFQIINFRHDWTSPTIFTSNLSLVELGKHLGERTTWRIAEMAEVVNLAGKNLRAKG